MELVLCVVSLSAILLFLPGVYLNIFQVKQLEHCNRPFTIPCFSSTRRGSKGIKEVQELVVPQTRAGMCLYYCMFNFAQLVSTL